LQSLIFGATSRGFQFTFGKEDNIDENPGAKPINPPSTLASSSPPRSPSLSSHCLNPTAHDSDESLDLGLESDPPQPSKLCQSPLPMPKHWYSNQTVNSPPVSPCKKKPKHTAASAARIASEIAAKSGSGQEPQGLLCFFKPTIWEVEYKTNVVKRVEM